MLTVTDYYNNMRNKVKTTLKEKAMEQCRATQVPERLCQVPMQAATEFTPRYDPARNNLRRLMKFNASPIKPRAANYDPPDVYNPKLHPPGDALDVIAILESGVEFVPNLARIRRRKALLPTDQNPQKPGASTFNPEIVAGKGWSRQGMGSNDMCNGEIDSWCNKHDSNKCLLTGHNDQRGELVFDSYSGWGIFELPNVKEGLIIIKYHDWNQPNFNLVTKGWCSVNNETPCGTENGRALGEEEEEVRRQLKPQVPAYCDDFVFEFAIDGKVTTWDKDTWVKNLVQAQRVVQITTLLDDPGFTGGTIKNVELAMRITGCAQHKPLALTHIYWA